MKIKNIEYIYIKCGSCDERVKIAQNKGSYWKEYPKFIAEFLLDHSDCEVFDFVLNMD